LPSYPVVASTAVLAIAATAAFGLDVDVSPLMETALIRRGQLWRLITSAFVHGGALHLLFNIYWLWIFGTTVERVLGHARTLALILLFAYGSGALEYAFSSGGIGLSGVVYGLFGLLWVLSRSDARFAHVIDGNIIQLFVVWFFICIAMTVTNVYPVANIAHAVGAVLGILTGFAVADPRRRHHFIGPIAAFLLFGTWAATLGRPSVNLSSWGGSDECRLGYEAQTAKNYADAVRWLRAAATYRSMPDLCWVGLGFNEKMTGRPKEAVAAYRNGAERGEPLAQTALGDVLANGTDGVAKDEKRAADWYRKAADKGNALAQNNLAWLLANTSDSVLHDPAAAVAYAEKAVASEKGSTNAGYVDTLAAAQFANRQCETAVKTERLALSLAAASERSEYQKRLEQYEGAIRTASCR
jgi:membrane associated rhomboid family serine protease